MSAAAPPTDSAGTASGNVDAGSGDVLAELRRQQNEAEEEMQAAVDADDFDEASRLQEVIDELSDKIADLE